MTSKLSQLFNLALDISKLPVARLEFRLDLNPDAVRRMHAHFTKPHPKYKIFQNKSLGAALVDLKRFADPDALDFERTDNRHLAFGWAAHFCFGAPLARMEGRIAFRKLLERLNNVALAADKLEWRENLGLRGLKALPVRFDS